MYLPFLMPESADCQVLQVLTESDFLKFPMKDADRNVLLTHTAAPSSPCVITSHASITGGSTYTLTVGPFATGITTTGTVYGSSGSSGGMGGRKQYAPDSSDVLRITPLAACPFF